MMQAGLKKEYEYTQGRVLDFETNSLELYNGEPENMETYTINCTSN